MGIFDKIKGAIFNSAEAAASAAERQSASATQVGQAAVSGTPSSGSSVDIGAILDKAAAATGQRLNWRTSIVDLMKALNLDSSLGARKELAQELNYPGDTNNSAAMNVWLHSELMKRLEANGGKLPPGL